VRALIKTAEGVKFDAKLLRAVEERNNAQKSVLFDKVNHYFKGALRGKTFAVWGLAFKPNTDDMREAPSRVLARELVSRGASLRMHDPVSMAEARRVLDADLADLPGGAARVSFHENQMDALDGADALVIVTEWKVFRSPDFGQIKRRLKTPVIFDGRNLYEPEAMVENGVEYHAIGRATRPAVNE
jgi:UDPglucose 6-dehydrogenase